MENQITVVCGHYGCGKTNLSINLAMDNAKDQRETLLLDMDIVNPYFRSSEYGDLLFSRNIRLISPVFAGTTLDTPTLSPEMYAAFTRDHAQIIIDAGGDDVGATALGSLRTQIQANGYEMIYVINQYRVLSQTPKAAAALLKEIQAACGLFATAIVNNSHLGVDTTWKTVADSIPFAEETAALCGLQLLYSTIPDFALRDAGSQPEDRLSRLDLAGCKVIRRYVRFPWER